jgi:mono/diheme cytochrome c family protein
MPVAARAYSTFSTAFMLLLALSTGCSTKSDSRSLPSTIKSRQYYVQGEQLYVTHCSNCHQKNGSGLGLVYPPLNKSDYMDQNFESVICLMKYGIKGEIEVNGKKFNKEMQGISTLTDLEVAEIATYIYNTWEHQRDSIDIQHVSRILLQCPREQ